MTDVANAEDAGDAADAEDAAPAVLLRASGLTPSATEAAELARIYPCSRRMAETLHRLPEARYAEPATEFDAGAPWP